MKDTIEKIKGRIKEGIKKINLKSKKAMLIIGLFLVGITSGAILLSYSYYIEKGPSNLVISGFALASDGDMVLKIYHEDRDANGNGLGTYTRKYFVPQVNYTYNATMTSCTKGVEITKYSNYEFSVSASNKGFCKVYFDAVDGYASDSSFRLFVEQTMGSRDYEEVGGLPKNDYVYKVDTTRTTCTDSNATVDIVRRKIEITSSSEIECEVYAYIEALTGGGIYALSETVLAKESSDDYTSSQDGSIYRVVNQNGVRYEGKNPDNYVYYNCTDESDTSTCELWRIIGTFNGSDMNLDPNKKYTKIARSTPLETYMSWNSTSPYENDWVNASLNTYLNGVYFASFSENAQSMVAQYNGKYSLWHLRGTDFDTYETLYAAGWYEIERNTGTPGYRNGVAGAADAAKEAAIGLMYPSDYGYAAYGTVCNNENTETVYYYAVSCGAVDWLLYSDDWEWLMSPIVDNSDFAFTVYAGFGGAVDYVDVYSEYAARPTLYLSSEVEIVGGNGSEDSPYELYYEAPKEYLSETVLALERSEDYTSSQDGSIYRVVNQNGVRYEGKDPDNYVWYNCTDDNDTTTCERWRIIGVFDGTDVGLDSSKKYTKIARSTPLETYMSWNSTSPYENDWVNSTLNTYLNGEYLSSLSTTAQGMIATYYSKYSLWHLLGPNGSELQTYYTPDMYRAERDITVGTPGYRNGTAGAADAAKEAAIGLMYPSDYGYAAYGTACNNESTETLLNYEGSCAAVDWLFSHDWEWLISPYADNSGIAFYVNGYRGYVNGVDGVSAENAARPVLYLEADIEVVGGNGSEDSPYELY